MSVKLSVVILAAGQGTRMRSSLPKVLHPVGGRPMLAHVMDAVSDAFSERIAGRIHVVIGYGAERVRHAFHEASVNWIVQKKQLGTGHAVMLAAPFCQDADVVLVLYGDVPLIFPGTLQKLVAAADHGRHLALLTAIVDHPDGYGRILRDLHQKVEGIVEEKDATLQQKLVREISTGIMAIPGKHLTHWLDQLCPRNAQNEYYLTDLVCMAAAHAVDVSSKSVVFPEAMGINDRYHLSQVERVYQQWQCRKLQKLGVTLLDPARVDIRGTLQADYDVTIDCNCIFEGHVVIEHHVFIGSGCIIRDAVIGHDTVILPHSIIEGSTIGPECSIGPFARLRSGTVIKKAAKIGNFVEIKKGEVGQGSKINHLSYIGDTILGNHVNVGAGVVTCNYDGVNKHVTTIEERAFIGSNTSLVAPVTVGKEAVVGAGSVITNDVAPQQLAVARNRQRNISNWKKPEKQKK